MKIFVILSRVPYPLEKGDKLRAYHQLRELSRSHQIVLCCLSDSPVHPDARQKLSEICAEIHIFHLQKWRIYFNLFLCIFSRKPFQVMYFYQRKVHRAITALIASTKPDHIYCQLIRTAEYAKDEHAYRKTLDYQDAFSKGIERREQKARWPLKAVFAAERRRLIAYENIIFEYFEAKTIISDEDRRHIYHPERKDIAIITNGIDTEYFAPQPDAARSCDVLFTGNMSYPPNIEVAEYIVREVLPLLKKSKPDIAITLAGSSPHRRVKQLENVGGVTVTGWVEDIRGVYASAKCFFAPMQSGTGLQNKLLEAMAMELPCVASPLANRPLKAVDSESIKIADNAESYAAAILAILNDQTHAEALGRNGRTFVKKNFSWSESAAQLESVMLAQKSPAAV
jgi:sugar transferase (PEP-CTERM/EpsH1 system associated)